MITQHLDLPAVMTTFVGDARGGFTARVGHYCGAVRAPVHVTCTLSDLRNRRSSVKKKSWRWTPRVHHFEPDREFYVGWQKGAPPSSETKLLMASVSLHTHMQYTGLPHTGSLQDDPVCCTAARSGIPLIQARKHAHARTL